jgi:mevalonate kinase
MPIVFGKAPGKIIIFGEHAVVYGQPAIAIPVHEVAATARVIPDLQSEPGHVRVLAPGIDLDSSLHALDASHPIAAAIHLTIEELGVKNLPSFILEITSTIPISAGLGSGAAVSVAIIRALSTFLGRNLPDDDISELAYEVEKIHHGTPSGIDNTVVTQAQPVYFIKGHTETGHTLQTFSVPQPFHWVIADTGMKTPTRETVGDVRKAWEKDPVRLEEIFTRIGAIVKQAQRALTTGDPQTLGRLMDQNQTHLETLGVSSHELDLLIRTARQAGALGAKLSGGGRGGNMIALASEQKLDTVAKALSIAGATQVITTTLGKTYQ